jgi:hypothetical protein
MIRTSVKSENNVISFSIPEEYVGKQIEVIAFRTDEGISHGPMPTKQVSFTVLKSSLNTYQFNREEANER